MVKRLFSLIVALAIAGPPLALEACQIACTSTSAHPMAAHGTHHDDHHHAAAGETCHELPVTPQQLSPHAPPCNHDGEATVASVTAARTSDGVLLGPAAAPAIANVVVAASPTFVPLLQSPLPERLEIRLASPLRI